MITQSFTYPEPTEIDTFYTNAAGVLYTPEPLEYGTGFSLVECFAPYGYVLNTDPVYFDVTPESAAEEGGITIVEVTKPNMAQKGLLKSTKLVRYSLPSYKRKTYINPSMRSRAFPAQYLKSPRLKMFLPLTGRCAIQRVKLSIPLP